MGAGWVAAAGGDVTCCVGEREGLHGAAGSPLGGRQVLRELEGVDGVPGAALRRRHPALLFLLVLGDFETPPGLGEALVGHVAVALLRAKPPRVVVLPAVLDEAAAVALHRQRGAPLRVAEMFRPQIRLRAWDLAGVVGGPYVALAEKLQRALGLTLLHFAPVVIELVPAPPQVLPVEARRLAGQAQQIHLQGQRVHVGGEAVGGDLQLAAGAARPLLAFPLVLADLGAAAGLLGSRALESRVGGVGAVGVVADAAGPGAEDLALLGQERPPQQGLLALRAAEAGLGGVPVLAVVRHLALVDTLRGKERRGASELARVRRFAPRFASPARNAHPGSLSKALRRGFSGMGS